MCQHCSQLLRACSFLLCNLDTSSLRAYAASFTTAQDTAVCSTYVVGTKHCCVHCLKTQSTWPTLCAVGTAAATATAAAIAAVAASAASG
jgi:hypothetical protein